WPRRWSPEETRSQADFYHERCAAHGRQPTAIALRRDIYVGQSTADAQAVLHQALSKGYRGIPAEALIAGSIDEVAKQFRVFGERGTPTSSCAISRTISRRSSALWSGWKRCVRRWPRSVRGYARARPLGAPRGPLAFLEPLS